MILFLIKKAFDEKFALDESEKLFHPFNKTT